MSSPREEPSEFVVLPVPADVEPAWYAVYLRVRTPAAVHQRLMLLLAVLAAAVLLLTGGSSVMVNAAIAGVAGLTVGTAAYLRSRAPEVGVSLGPDTVGFGRRDSQMRYWPRSSLRSVQLNGPYSGERVEPALTQYLVPGCHYLTLTRVDGVVAHVALDRDHAYSDIIEDVLVHGRPLTALSHPPVRPNQKQPSRSMWDKDAVDRSVTPKPGGPPTAPTISARPGETAAPTGAPAAGSAGRPAETPGTNEPDEILWHHATQRHDAVLLAYAPYEVDPHMVMRYPAITDVTCPRTATFVAALGDASALRTAAYPSSTTLSTAYRDAVAALEIAWNAAERYAHNVGLDLLEPEDRKHLVQARKLLAHAESSTADAERAVYFQQVKALMDDLAGRGAIVEPPQVRREIATRVAQALTSSEEAN